MDICADYSALEIVGNSIYTLVSTLSTVLAWTLSVVSREEVLDVELDKSKEDWTGIASFLYSGSNHMYVTQEDSLEIIDYGS